jgi:hypothetical protein
MHRPVCWTTAVELNATAGATAIGSSDLEIEGSSNEQPMAIVETTAQRIMDRACLGFIEASAQTATSIRNVSSTSDHRREQRP